MRILVGIVESDSTKMQKGDIAYAKFTPSFQKLGKSYYPW